MTKVVNIQTYRAQILQREIGLTTLVMDSLAGLASAALAQGELSSAKTHVEEILDYLNDHTLEGIGEPTRVYLTCYRVLHACGDSRSSDVLQLACNDLQARAAKITDEELRRSFLENVSFHRELHKECAEESGCTT